MAWRFRRSFKVLPGIRLNIGKTGFTSISVGGRGNRLNFSKRGTRHTLGLPGTGLSYSTLIPSSGTTTTSSSHPSRSVTTGAVPLEIALQLEVTSADLQRFGIERREIAANAGRGRTLVLALGLLAVFASLYLPSPSGAIAGIALLVGWLMPSRKSLVAREQERCRHLVHIEREKRLHEFRTRLKDTSGADLASLEAILTKQQESGLTDDEIDASAMATIRATADLHRWSAVNEGRVATIDGVGDVIAPDASCFFTTAAIYDKRGENDPSGTLYLTEARALFVSDDGLTSVPWKKVISTSRDGNELKIVRRDRQNPTVFWIGLLLEAMKADTVTARLLEDWRNREEAGQSAATKDPSDDG